MTMENKSVTWERAVPVYGVPVLTKGFWALAAIFVVAGVVTLWREYFGLTGLSGMTDAYAWGLWKTFNVMVLTGLGSGGFAVGIGAWLCNNHKLHSVMRAALLTSFLAYGTGLVMLGIDVGRPWNFYWIAWIPTWNGDSPLMEVAFCVSFYTCVPLFLENVPPMLEYVIYAWPQYKKWALRIEKAMFSVYPGIVALAYLLPMMHQSSLGALMILGGARVHTLWQSPVLPLLYVWAAAYLGYACVILTLLLANLAWKRALDYEVMALLNKIGTRLIYGWAAVRLLDILVRGQFLAMFGFKGVYFALLFWCEMALVVGGAWWAASEKGKLKSNMFYAYCLIAAGGMIYRFSPTTLAFSAKPNSFYFPGFWELVMCVGFISLGALGFLVAVKKLSILPGTKEDWAKMEAYEKTKHPEAKYSGYQDAVEAQ